MLVGRKKEIDELDQCLMSGRPEFVAIFGRRRIGKTYLVREYFKGSFSFYVTGIADASMRDQLRAFGASLQAYGCSDKTIPKDWFEAFSRLIALLSDEKTHRDSASGRLVVFLDELPWFDTPRSSFKPALEHFWNGWASAQSDILLVACGSATSWILNNLVSNTGGFYNRVTRQIHLEPFTLAECEEFFRANDVAFTRQQIVESYMVFGGVPHYLNLIDRRMSLAQNIDRLCFAPYGQLRHEREFLFKSLFKGSGRHTAVVDELSKHKAGMLRTDLAATAGIGDGQPLTDALNELEQCGFIRKYRDFTKKKNGQIYQLIDPFSLFAAEFLAPGNISSWQSYIGTPGYHAWTGRAFELVCLLHIGQMKAALGISGVQTEECAWRSKAASPGAQIDLLIDRRDGVVNICEMKYSDRAFVIEAATERNLRNKLAAFAEEVAPDKALHLTMVTMHGTARNAHAGIVLNEVTAEDLFEGPAWVGLPSWHRYRP